VEALVAQIIQAPALRESLVKATVGALLRGRLDIPVVVVVAQEQMD
jgi:hypothetical protein